MRTKNFFKSLAVAAVALVGVFATSCSEEELKVNTTPVEIPDLPDGFAQAVLTVVDLGDMGVAPKVLKNETINLTVGKNEIPCPSFNGSEEYVIPVAQEINVPELKKGTSFSYSVTFYVIKMSSAFEGVKETTIEDGENPNPEDLGTGSWMEWYYFAEATESATGLENADLKNDSEYDKDVTFTYIENFGCSPIEEKASARIAATTDEEVIAAYVNNKLAWADDEKFAEYEASLYLEIPACSYAIVNVYNFYSQPVIALTYGDTTKEYTYKQWWGAGTTTKFEIIPGHEHGHDHGHGHGGSSNAGGGSAE